MRKIVSCYLKPQVLQKYKFSNQTKISIVKEKVSVESITEIRYLEE